jgi:hypothetical protein
MNREHTVRTQKHYKKRKVKKAKTNKLIDRLTFNPQKHKQKISSRKGWLGRSASLLAGRTARSP